MKSAPSFLPKERGSYWHEKGYRRTYAPDHPFPRKSGYVYEHVRLMELHLGRKMLPTESVHHKNEVKSHNVISNLEVKDRVAHTGYHCARQRRDAKGRYRTSRRR